MSDTKTEATELYDQAMERAAFPEDLGSPDELVDEARAEMTHAYNEMLPSAELAPERIASLTRAEDRLLAAVVALQQAIRSLKATEREEAEEEPAEPVVPPLPDALYGHPLGGEPVIPAPDYGDDPAED